MSNTPEDIPRIKPLERIYIESSDPSLTGNYTVNNDGTLLLPLLKPVTAAGLSHAQLAQNLTALCVADMFSPPHFFTVQAAKEGLDDFPFVRVEGEVRTPRRRVPLHESTPRLFQVLMKNGGPTEFADMKNVKLIRNGRETLIDMQRILPDASNNPLMESGDTIVILRRHPGD